MQRKQALLSRLDQEAYVKLPAYAADYWNEHRENFAGMLKDLMLDETFKSVLGDASKTSLKWNHLKYNEDVILEACVVPDLHSLRSQLQDLLRQGHKGIPIEVHEGKASPDTPLQMLFGSDVAKQRMKFLAEELLGTSYDAHMYATVFVPQLHIFFLRILDVYDRSLQGRLVADYLASRHIDAGDVRRKEESLQDEESVKSFWVRAAATISPEARAAAISRAMEAMKSDNEELGKELLVLQAGTQKTCHDLSAAATEKGMAFAEKWRAMSTEERKEILAGARNALSAPDQPRLGVFYCPELHTGDLSANQEAFLQFLSKAKEPGMPELQTLTGVITHHVESEQRGGSLPVIVFTRQYVIAQFCLRTIAAVLAPPK